MPPIKPSADLRREVFEERHVEQIVRDWIDPHKRVVAKAAALVENVPAKNGGSRWLDDPEQSNDTETLAYRVSKRRGDLFLELLLREAGEEKSEGESESVAHFHTTPGRVGYDLISYGGRSGPFETEDEGYRNPSVGVTIPGDHGKVLDPEHDPRFKDIEDTLNLMARLAIEEGRINQDDLVETGSFSLEDLSTPPVE